MFNRFLFSLVVLAFSFAVSAGAWAEERFALVIGNSKYQRIAALPNPANDARAVKRLLDTAGFEVISALDLGQEDMRAAVRDFASRIGRSGGDSVALIYFAGHGLQINGENFLLPVDANIAGESDVALEGVRLSDIMNILDTVPSKSRIVILDACRNNPFKEISEAGKGLAIVNAPAGTVVAYSTSPGATAEDGRGENSPFTAALIAAAKEPGAALETVFQNTRLAVHKATQGRQTPWEVTALTEPFQFFKGDAGDQTVPVPEKTDDQWRAEITGYTPRQAYDVVIQQNNVIVYEIFLTIYGDSSWGRRIRAIMERRLEMLAWFEAVTLNSEAAFEAFLKRYPDSDLAVTAKRLADRAAQRSIMPAAPQNLLGLAPKPEIRTVVKEVKVPVVREVIKEVKVPVEVIKEVKVPVEVIKRVRVPVEVIKEVKVPVIKEVVKIKRVPVVKEVVKIKRVPVVKEVVRIKTVRVPCKCSGPSRTQGGKRSPSLVAPSFNMQINRQIHRRRR